MAVEKRYKMTVCFYPFNIHCGRRLVKCIRHDCGGVNVPPNKGPGYVSDTPLLPRASSFSVLGQFTGGKTASVDSCSHPLQTILRLFHPPFPPSFLPLCVSHDGLPLLLHHGWGFLVLAGPRGSRMLLIRDVELLSWGRYGVFRDRTVLHVPGEVAVTVHGHWSESGGEMEGQRRSGGDVGDAGVWHHRSVAVCVTAAPSFPFEVQRQGPPAPGLFDLSLHLQRNVCS